MATITWTAARSRGATAEPGRAAPGGASPGGPPEDGPGWATVR
ncbi:MAG TPA: hypothetical protein VGA42_02090 [Gemmatimonadales bacterium]